MAAEGRVRISLAAGELEIEGTTDFVKIYDESINEMLRQLVSQEPPKRREGHLEGAEDGHGTGGDTDGGTAGTSAVGTRLELGEALQLLDKNATGTDKILVAAWYAQRDNASNEFTTGEANKRLMDKGVKLSNAAQCVKQNVGLKRVFKLNGNKWRVSQSGVEYLTSVGIAQ